MYFMGGIADLGIEDDVPVYGVCRVRTVAPHALWLLFLQMKQRGACLEKFTVESIGGRTGIVAKHIVKGNKIFIKLIL